MGDTRALAKARGNETVDHPGSVGIKANTRAESPLRERRILGDGCFADIAVWRVPKPVRGSGHDYNLAYVVGGVCVLRRDNEAGKGDHRHDGAEQKPYAFRGPERLVDDFFAAIAARSDEWPR